MLTVSPNINPNVNGSVKRSNGIDSAEAEMAEQIEVSVRRFLSGFSIAIPISLKPPFPSFDPHDPVADPAVDRRTISCIYLCMGTKTLSVDEEAYRALVRARRHRGESFSKVIKRAKWDDGPKRCGNLLARASGTVSEATLAVLVSAQENDLPPEDKWNR